jgi:ubiquinone/menaquinone biosynthesis C-methylase UbiE
MRKFVQYRTPKFKFLYQVFKKEPFKLLDVGAGNHSASKTKKLFPACEYHGIDQDQGYENGEEDFKAMDVFYNLDLTKLQFDKIPDNYFDFIRMTHVIEHLHNGDQVVLTLLKKLKSGGYIYMEYPSERSRRLPSMEGTLNFYDDKTHVRIYSVNELVQLLGDKARVIKSGVRRNVYYLLAMPFRMAARWLQGKRLLGNIFWDLFGFAEYVFAQKR